MRKKYESIKVEERVKKELEALAKASGLTQSQVIMRFLSSEETIRKDMLNDHFEKLKKLFPAKESILDYMRLIILRSNNLQEDLAKQCDELMEKQLGDLLDAVLDIEKSK